MLRKHISAETALQRLEALCARAEHCQHELSEKLRRWGVSSSDAGKILDSLEKRKFFSDSRFAEAYARDKLLYSEWGRMKIVMGLRAKRVGTDEIDNALEALDPEEYKRVAIRCLRSKARSIKEGYTYEGRTKLYRAGLQRGFESQLVAEIVKDSATWPQQD